MTNKTLINLDINKILYNKELSEKHILFDSILISLLNNNQLILRTKDNEEIISYLKKFDFLEIEETYYWQFGDQIYGKDQVIDLNQNTIIENGKKKINLKVRKYAIVEWLTKFRINEEKFIQYQSAC